MFKNKIFFSIISIVVTVLILPLFLFSDKSEDEEKISKDKKKIYDTIPDPNNVGVAKSYFIFSQSKEGPVFSAKINLNHENNLWWAQINSGGEGKILDILSGPFDGVEFMIGYTHTELDTREWTIKHVLEPIQKKYHEYYKMKDEKFEDKQKITIRELEQKHKDELYELYLEYKKNKRRFISSPRIFSAFWGVNYSQLAYIHFKGANEYEELVHKKFGFKGGASYSHYLSTKGVIGLTIQYVQKWDKPKSENKLPADFATPQEWFSKSIYFEPMQKVENLEIILNWKEYLNNVWGINPGIRYTYNLLDDEKRVIEAFLGFYTTIDKSGQWSVGFRPGYSYDYFTEKSSLTMVLFLTKGFRILGN